MKKNISEKTGKEYSTDKKNDETIYIGHLDEDEDEKQEELIKKYKPWDRAKKNPNDMTFNYYIFGGVFGGIWNRYTIFAIIIYVCWFVVMYYVMGVKLLTDFLFQPISGHHNILSFYSLSNLLIFGIQISGLIPSLLFITYNSHRRNTHSMQSIYREIMLNFIYLRSVIKIDNRKAIKKDSWDDDAYKTLILRMYCLFISMPYVIHHYNRGDLKFDEKHLPLHKSFYSKISKTGFDNTSLEFKWNVFIIEFMETMTELSETGI